MRYVVHYKYFLSMVPRGKNVNFRIIYKIKFIKTNSQILGMVQAMKLMIVCTVGFAELTYRKVNIL